MRSPVIIEGGFANTGDFARDIIRRLGGESGIFKRSDQRVREDREAAERRAQVVTPSATDAKTGTCNVTASATND